MRRSRNFALSFIVMALFSISSISCVLNLGLSLGDSGEKTGIVSGRVNDVATIALNQADGTTRTATTSTENPTYNFKEVPVGKTKIDTTLNGTTTSQVIQVVANKITRVYPFGSNQKIDNSLWGSVFEMPEGSNSVTQISSEPLGDEFYTKEINIPVRAFSEGFPGLTDRFEWFGVIYEGEIAAPVDGEYTFKILCDDGVILSIDDEEVVLSGDGISPPDSIHPPKEYIGKISLSEGEVYSFMLEYFQGPRFHIALVLEVQIPGQEMKLFNMDDFK